MQVWTDKEKKRFLKTIETDEEFRKKIFEALGIREGEVLRGLQMLGVKVDGLENKFEIEMESLRSEHKETMNQLESGFKIEMEKLRNEHNERIFELEKKFMERTYEMEKKFEVEMEKIRSEHNERMNQMEKTLKLKWKN